MRQKRTFTTLLLIIAVLCLGIAYAAITQQTLTINGSAKAASYEEKAKVAFTKAEVKTKPAYLTEADVYATIEDDITATINVSNLKVKGDTATFEYTITNKQTDIAVKLEDANVYISGELVSGGFGEGWGDPSGWFDVTASSLVGTELTANNEEGTLESASTKLTVTVTLKETPVTEQQEADAEDTIEITINANPVAPSV